MTPPPEIIARIKDLKVHYPIRKGFLNIGEKQTLKAVDGVSLDLAKGEILGLVGESGCGKSSFGRAVLRLITVTSGSIEIANTDFLALQGNDLRKARPYIQMIFQDPYASLDPRMTVFDVLSEPVKAHMNLTRGELAKRV